MNTAFSRVRNFLVSEDGPTAVEYAVMLALIVVACITIIQSLGTSVSSTFNSVNTSLGGGSGS
jgi:pilus assembly protein Flp/PilA